ncbi:MAG TPA: oligopeptide/dipeptide ABC transporter ATP-binding protein [Stellaceae bacterium]|nr:oligopeptide/dipeptide ABC transporter ATP-binding protein [Stellaceae bacterium]
MNPPPVSLSSARDGAPAAPLLQVEGLCKTFRLHRAWPRKPQQLQAVSDISLELGEARTLGIVGESGCGKSTLSRMLAGTLPPSAGSIRLDGIDVGALRGASRRQVLRDVQMVFQSPYTALDPRMSIGRIVREPLDIHERHLSQRERTERVADMLVRVGLNASYLSRYPQQLSGGQQQRVGIARALVRRARIVICDEPVSALDVSVQAQVVNLLRELQRGLKVSYVFVSHDLAVVANIAHEIAVMYMGRVVEFGGAGDVLRAPRHPYTQALVDSANIPDPKVERARAPRLLGGELPDPTDPPSGCRFRTRCWQATELCAATAPALEPRPGAPQRVACHYA